MYSIITHLLLVVLLYYTVYPRYLRVSHPAKSTSRAYIPALVHGTTRRHDARTPESVVQGMNSFEAYSTVPSSNGCIVDTNLCGVAPALGRVRLDRTQCCLFGDMPRGTSNRDASYSTAMDRVNHHHRIPQYGCCCAMLLSPQTILHSLIKKAPNKTIGGYSTRVFPFCCYSADYATDGGDGSRRQRAGRGVRTHSIPPDRPRLANSPHRHWRGRWVVPQFCGRP